MDFAEVNPCNAILPADFATKFFFLNEILFYKKVIS
jgi:hypothetical protein